ncbi:MAG: epoxide hydrolase family protein [Streptosporangiaceae bacterium]|jgi:pimeloyl-ACP methyl ester carboxylesterase
MTPTAEITPFRIDIPQPALDDLRDRLARTRWPSQITGLGWSRGADQLYLQELAEYWQHHYDWRLQEAELNKIPQFTTEIDGANIHFLHIRSGHADATPLILTHGWPGSIVEFLDVVGPFTDPVAHGGEAADAFHLVIPSLPGFGFSGPAGEAGWDSYRIAAAFAGLMSRLGYDRYLAQGGDFGAFVSPDLGRVAADHVIGVHVNAATMGFIPFGELDEDTMASLTDTEKARVARLGAYMSDGNGYFQIQATRPNTLGFALNDSPVGQLAWIVEKFKEWSHPSSGLPEQSIDRDRMLTNVMLYWLTGTGASSAQLYYESMHSGRWPSPSPVPTGVAAFAEDVSIRRFAEASNNIVHWTDFDEGGHFAAMEKPGLLVADVRRFRNALR